MRTLSENLQVSMPTMSGIVERLVRGGYARRVTDTEDRRQVRVELTPQGRSIISQFQQAASRRWQDVLLALRQDEIELFGNVVTKLLNSLKKPRPS